jgi:hypothetical protein
MAATLPEEVWLEIVTLVGYSLEAPGHALDLIYTVAKSVHALSFVSRQFRRICYPFVFRRVVCHGSESLGVLHSEIVKGSEIAAHIKYVPSVGRDARIGCITWALYPSVARLSRLPLPKTVWFVFYFIFHLFVPYCPMPC